MLGAWVWGQSGTSVGPGLSWLGIRVWGTKGLSKGLGALGLKHLKPTYYSTLSRGQGWAFVNMVIRNTQFPKKMGNFLTSWRTVWFLKNSTPWCSVGMKKMENSIELSLILNVFHRSALSCGRGRGGAAPKSAPGTSVWPRKLHWFPYEAPWGARWVKL